MMEIPAGYSPMVLEHFSTPSNAGSFPTGTPRVLSGSAGVRRHGRAVTFQLQLDPEGRVTDCRYRVYGCPATIALCSLSSQALKGKPLNVVAAFSVVALAEQLGLPAEKRTAAITVEDAIRSAAERYNSSAGLQTGA